MQTIYDTDDESFQSLEVSEDSFDLFSASFQIISNNFHVIGIEQTFGSKDEEERNKEIFGQVEIKELFLKKEEAIEHTLAQEYNNLLIEYSPLNQSLPGLQEDNTAKYDESSSSDDDEEEGEKQIEDCPTKDIPSSQEESFSFSVKNDDASKQFSEDVLLTVEALEADNLPDMEGQKEENLHIFFL